MKCNHSGQCEQNCECQCEICIIVNEARKTAMESLRRLFMKCHECANPVSSEEALLANLFGNPILCEVCKEEEENEEELILINDIPLTKYLMERMEE